MSFAISKRLEGNLALIDIQGAIDEDSTFASVDCEGVKSVVIDLDKVTAINSVGIREWMRWIKEFPPNVKLSVSRCPKIIVDQINMVAGFLPANTQILSFYVPYFSESSGAEKMVLFENGREYKDKQLFIPTEVKDDEGELMEIDVIETKYFKFLNG